MVIVLLVYLASQTLLDDGPTRGGAETRITYGDLVQRVHDSPASVREVVFVPNGQRIEVTLTSGARLESNYPTDAAQLELQHGLEASGVHFDSKGNSDLAWWSILTYLLPFALFAAFWIFLMHRREYIRAPEHPDR